VNKRWLFRGCGVCWRGSAGCTWNGRAGSACVCTSPESTNPTPGCTRAARPWQPPPGHVTSNRRQGNAACSRCRSTPSSSSTVCRRLRSPPFSNIIQGPDLQNVLRQSYDYLTIMPKLRSTYDELLIYKTPYTKSARLFLGTIHLQSCTIV